MHTRMLVIAIELLIKFTASASTKERHSRYLFVMRHEDYFIARESIPENRYVHAFTIAHPSEISLDGVLSERARFLSVQRQYADTMLAKVFSIRS